jgi:hypothetical protein
MEPKFKVRIWQVANIPLTGNNAVTLLTFCVAPVVGSINVPFSNPVANSEPFCDLGIE